MGNDEEQPLDGELRAIWKVCRAWKRLRKVVPPFVHAFDQEVELRGTWSAENNAVRRYAGFYNTSGKPAWD
ncbi:hypothetical protein CSAL01_12022 [Colletotrichum salicis]|uniref:Uncharacterized protein n=1 Tax=Colletotrichum salicis TaxID=1209931 RepID=A0A135RNP4_9PEZI|nr:hypothetical protein CSAL01_12022 [Colletotrichum salicis]